MKTHEYKVEINWTGNNGSGTSEYKTYSRNHDILVTGKPVLQASSDTIFNGDGSRHNPEDLFVASIAQCHMLWYLHLCADHKVIVTAYKDNALGILDLGHEPTKFTAVVLNPEVTVQDASMIEKAQNLHELAHEKCFIANSCNFPVTHQASCQSNQ